MSESAAHVQGIQTEGATAPKEEEMTMIMDLLRSIWSDDEGQDLAEYALLLILVAVLIVAAIQAFRGEIGNAFSKATSALATAS